MLGRLALLLALASAAALAGCRSDDVDDGAPPPAATGIALAAPHARGASFEAPAPAALPKIPGLPKPLPPDPFSGAPDDADPAPSAKPGVNL